MAMHWTRNGTGWTCRVLPDAIFTLNVRPKGDGRWDWEVYPQGGERTIAGGIVNSLGAAKTICENFANRSGKF